jgi:hypothetical protein
MAAPAGSVIVPVIVPVPACPNRTTQDKTPQSAIFNKRINT